MIRGRQKKAFTLMEVLASLLLLEIIFLHIMTMYNLSAKTLLINEDNLRATLVLQRKIEEIKAKNFSANVQESNSEYSDEPGYKFWVIETLDYLSLGSNLKKVDVTMRWDNPYKVQRAEFLSFLIANDQ